MAHVELSLTEAFVPQARMPAEPRFAAGIDRWTDTVTAADEPCLVLARDTSVLAVSAACCELLGLGDPALAVGQKLLDGLLRLVDFTAARGELSDLECGTIPPLLALTSERPARGLMRVLLDPADVTVDAVATPLLDDGSVMASLTFFSAV